MSGKWMVWLLDVARNIRESLRLESRFSNSHLGGVQKVNNLLTSSRKKVWMGKPESSLIRSVLADFQADNLAATGPGTEITQGSLTD